VRGAEHFCPTTPPRTALPRFQDTAADRVDSVPLFRAASALTHAFDPFGSESFR
jgi:hypothetical protein